MLPAGTFIAMRIRGGGARYLVREHDGLSWRTVQAPSAWPSFLAGDTTRGAFVHACGIDRPDIEGAGRIWYQRYERGSGWSQPVDVVQAAGGGAAAHDFWSVGGFCVPGDGPPPSDVLTLYIGGRDGRLVRVVRQADATWDCLEDVFSTHGKDFNGTIPCRSVTAAHSPNWQPGVDVEHVLVDGFYGARRYSGARLVRTVFNRLDEPLSFADLSCASSESLPRLLHVCWVEPRTGALPQVKPFYASLRPAPGQSIHAQGGIWDPAVDIWRATSDLPGYWQAASVACGVSGDVLHLITSAFTNERFVPVPGRLTYTSRSVSRGWASSMDLGAETFSVAPEFGGSLLFVPGPPTMTVRHGVTLRVRHVVTDSALYSHPFPYSHPGTSGQQQVTCFGGADENDLWRIKGPSGTSPDFRSGSPVHHGDVVRLEHVPTRKNLHSHSGFPSPLTGQQEVTCFGEAGVGDGNDDWRIEILDGPQWTAGRQLRLVHVATDHSLHSHAGYSHPVWTLEQQEVTCYAGRDANDLWSAADLPENDGVFVRQSVPSTLRPGQGQDVSVTMRNVGTEPWTSERGYRLGSQAPQDNQRWGLGRVPLPVPVLPGQDATFSFHVTAPTSPARRAFQWCMLQEGIAWFGDLTPLVEIGVSRSPQPTTVPDLLGLTRAQAADAIRAADLSPRFLGPPGWLTEVAQQAPTAGTTVERGTIVTIQLTSLT